MKHEDMRAGGPRTQDFHPQNAIALKKVDFANAGNNKNSEQRNKASRVRGPPVRMPSVPSRLEMKQSAETYVRAGPRVAAARRPPLWRTQPCSPKPTQRRLRAPELPVHRFVPSADPSVIIPDLSSDTIKSQ